MYDSQKAFVLEHRRIQLVRRQQRNQTEMVMGRHCFLVAFTHNGICS